MPRILLDVEFDGAAFSGTQAQAGLRTVQGDIAVLLRDLSGDGVQVRPASRLDRGVSARSLPIDAWIPRLPGRADDTVAGLRHLGQALASRLAADIAVRRIAAVDDGFNAQYRAIGKTYRYTVAVRGTKPVLDRRCWWVKRIDHPERLQDLADRLVGSKDLRSFASLRHDGSDEEDGVRTIDHAIWRADGDHWILTISGDGFLYKQIRGFVGSMVHVAQGRRTVAEFDALVERIPNAPRLGNIAPAEGLVLEEVRFDGDPGWMWV